MEGPPLYSAQVAAHSRQGRPLYAGVDRGLHWDVDMMTFPPRHSRMSLLLTLLLLAPGVGLAAEETPPPADAPTEQSTPSPDSPVPGTGTRPKLRLMDTPAPEPTRPSQPLRILAEVGAGLLTGTGGFLVGFMSLFVLGGNIFDTSVVGLIAPILVGIGSGVALGTWWGGELTGGDAKLEATFLGMLLGGTAGVLMSIPMGNPFLSLVTCPPLMLLGSIIGYESTERGATIKSVQPLLSVSSRGATFGLAGTF